MPSAWRVRLQAMGNPRYRRGSRITLHEDVLDLPRTWKAPDFRELVVDDALVTDINRRKLADYQGASAATRRSICSGVGSVLRIQSRADSISS
jgi:hypothetical protein